MHERNRKEEMIPILPAPGISVTGKDTLRHGELNSEEEMLQSANLLNDSAKHMYGLMSRLNATDPETIKSVTSLADQITKIARVSLDLVRVKKGTY